MDDKPIKPGSDSERRDDEQIAAARRQAEAWTPPASQTETTPAVEGGEVPVRFRDLPADSFPGYEIVKEVHRGGQGVVYLAVQKATKRKVAVKVMHEGPFAGPRDRARFEREVQILAALKHPNIVSIHDSGTAAGCFFYVMDYISGLPLDQYMASGERSIEDTLKLFAKICEAVNAAHLKGVIHRDLKPANIRIDSKGEPHVLDFGLAKLATGDVTADSRPAVMSMTGQFIGSLPWASPEQAEAMPDKIDIRTDVYSLGVILYQMLTGKFPYEVVGNMRDVLERILKAEPTRPSTIRRQINDEVETIALKCLQKERERRYQSAGELGRDVERYLLGEPIEAKRDSAMYVLRKQLRRYKIPVAIAGGFLVLLIGFAAAMSVLARTNRRLAENERRAKDSALAAKESETTEKERALAAEAESIRQRDAAELQSYFANITAADAALQINQVADMRRRLDAAPERFRNWEWRYLDANADYSLATLGGKYDRFNPVVSFSTDGTRVVTRFGNTSKEWDASTGSALADVSVGLASSPGSAYIERVSSDGTRMLTQSQDLRDAQRARVWDLTTGRELSVLLGTTGGIEAVSFSPDVSRLATGARDGTAKLWDTATGHELASLRGHKGEVNPVCFSPDGTRLVTASADGVARLWDGVTGREQAQLHGHSKRITSAGFSLDGTRIITCSEDSTAKLWFASTGEESATLRGHTAGVRCACFSADGLRVVTASNDYTARVWDAAAGTELATLRGHASVVIGATFSPDGTHVVTASSDKTARLWDATTEQELAVLRGHTKPVQSVSVGPDGTRIVTASLDGTAKLWDAGIDSKLGALRGHRGAVLSVSFSPDGNLILTGSSDGTAKLWNATTGCDLASLRGHAGPVDVSAFNSDGTKILTGSRNGTVRLWDAANASELVSLPLPENRYLASFAMTPNGARIVTGYLDGTAKLWDAVTCAELATLRGHPGAVRAVAFSPDGTRVVTGSDDGAVVLWDGATGAKIAALGGHAPPRVDGPPGHVTCAAFSPNGTRVLTADRNGISKLWDSVAGAEIFVWEGHRGAIESAAFSADGSRVITASNDRTAKLWDATTGHNVATLSGHTDRVSRAVFSLDGTRVVTVSRDGTAKLWDAAIGSELLTLRGHTASVQSVAFSPDGTRIITGSADHTAIVWDTTSYPARFTQRQAAEAQSATVRPKVEALLARFEDWSKVAEVIQQDGALGGVARSSALNLVLWLGNADRAEASDLVETLRKRIILKDEITASIRQDVSLRPTVRAEALRLIRSLDDSPLRLNNEAFALVRDPGGAAEAYVGALRAAAAACESEPDNGYYINTLGVARFRLGEYEQALATLLRSDTLNRLPDAPHNRARTRRAASQPATVSEPDLGVPANVAFIAMSLYQLSRTAEARTAFERLKKLMTQARWANDEESLGFLLEAEALILSTPA